MKDFPAILGILVDNPIFLSVPLFPGGDKIGPMNDLLAAIKARAREMAGELTSLRRDFHQHPELQDTKKTSGYSQSAEAGALAAIFLRGR